MMADPADIYVVGVKPASPNSEWTVSRARRVIMSGLSPTPFSAHRCGAMAAGALRALERIGRRRF